MKAPCVRCGDRVLVPNAAEVFQASMLFTPQQPAQLATDTLDPNVQRRALCALGLLDATLERETRVKLAGDNSITLHVDGMPQTKGSWKIIPTRRGARLKADNDAEPAWAQLVGWAAKIETGKRLRDLEFAKAIASGRWSVAIVFTLLPPPNKRRTNRRDLDKLARSVLDALTGIVWRDDEQVEQLYLDKTTGEKPCADIRLTPIL